MDSDGGVTGVKRRIKPWRGEKAESRQGFLSDGLKAGGVQGDEGHLENSTQRMAALWFFHVTQDTLEDQNTFLVQPQVLCFPL